MIRSMDKKEIREFLSTIHYSPTAGFRGIVSVKNGIAVSYVGYDSWTPNSVQMHVWLPYPRYLTRKFIAEAFRYPFEMCGRGLVIGLTPSNNTGALRLNRKIGFKEVYRIKDAWDLGVDVVLQEIRKEDCRWLGDVYGYRTYRASDTEAA